MSRRWLQRHLFQRRVPSDAEHQDPLHRAVAVSRDVKLGPPELDELLGVAFSLDDSLRHDFSIVEEIGHTAPPFTADAERGVQVARKPPFGKVLGRGKNRLADDEYEHLAFPSRTFWCSCQRPSEMKGSNSRSKPPSLPLILSDWKRV